MFIYFNAFVTLKMPVNAARVVALFRNDNSVCQVAEVTGFSRSSINRAVIPFQLAVRYDRRPGYDHCQPISARDDFIVSISLRNRFVTFVEVSNELQRVRGVNVTKYMLE